MAGLVASPDSCFRRSIDPLGAWRIPLDLLLLPRRLLQSILGRPAFVYRWRIAKKLSRRAVFSVNSPECSPLFPLSGVVFPDYSCARRLARSLVCRSEYRPHTPGARRRHNRAGLQCCSSSLLHLWLSFSSAFDRRPPGRNLEVAAAQPDL